VTCHSYRRGERMNRQSMDSSECLGVRYVVIFPEVASRWFFGGSMVLVDCMGIFLRFRILLTDDCTWYETCLHHLYCRKLNTYMSQIKHFTADRSNPFTHGFYLYINFFSMIFFSKENLNLSSFMHTGPDDNGTRRLENDVYFSIPSIDK
jgi:hypothetical protein